MASVTLLAAALRWAHHWGALADLIVASWAAGTLGALVVSLRSTDGPGRRAALFGLALAGVRSRPWSSPASPLPRVRIRRRLRGWSRGIGRGDPEPWDG